MLLVVTSFKAMVTIVKMKKKIIMMTTMMMATSMYEDGDVYI